ncbi:MAG TPA: LytTR family DNA-binding domain-containing protein [Chthoniobacterales bacterium]|nr:LytTR family DNA-binding domain-containing protein [Chthoniobacterales bacterium]
MKALIVDDERLARSELRRLLAAHPEIEVVGEAANANQAEEKIRALKPDLLFLDVQMPGRSGFKLLAQLPEAPHVIFTTAYDQYALKAFDFGAVDYLLKPIEPARLARALERLKTRRPDEGSSTEPPPSEILRENDQVFLKDGERCWLVRVGDIRLLESEGNYARVFFAEHRPLIPRTLQMLAARLDPQHFLRVSRQHIINLRAVRKVEPWFDGGLLLRLGENDPEVKVARRRAHELRERLSL